MGVVVWERQSLINTSAVEVLIEELARGRQTRRIGGEINLEPALHALTSGVSLADIVQQSVEHLEQTLIRNMLVATHGNKSEAARLLKIDYKTLYRKLKKYFGTISGTGSAGDEFARTSSVRPESWSHVEICSSCRLPAAADRHQGT